MRTLLLLFFISINLLGITQINTDSLWAVWIDTNNTSDDRLKAIEKMAYDGVLQMNPDSAYTLSQLQYDYAKILDDKERMGSAKNVQGISLQRRGQYKQSIPYFHEALAIDRESQDSIKIANTCQNLGVAMTRTGQLDSAVYYITIVLNIGEKYNNALLVGGGSNSLGILNLYLGEMGNARAVLSNGIEVLTEAVEKGAGRKEKNFLGNLHNTLGTLENHCLNHDIALEHFEIASGIYQELGLDHYASKVGANIGNIYEMKGNMNGAIELFEKSLESSRTVGDLQGVATNLSQLALALAKFKNLDKAEEYYLEAIEIHRELGSKSSVAKLYTSLGNIELQRHKFVSAKNYFSKELALTKEIRLEMDSTLTDGRGFSRSHQNLGAAYMELNMFDSSLYHLNIAREMKENSGEDNLGLVAVHWYLGKLYLKLGDEQAAMAAYQEAADLSTEFNLSQNLRRSEKALFKLFYGQGDLEQAETHLNSMLASRIAEFDNNLFGLTEYEKSLYFQDANREFDLVYEYALDNGNQSGEFVEKCYDLTMNSKGLLLNSSKSMSNKIIQSGDSVLIHQYYDWINLKNTIAKEQSKGNDVVEMEEEANQQEKELIKASHQLYGVRRINQFSWKDVQAKLSNNETAVEFVRFETRPIEEDDEETDAIYGALIITKDSERPEIVKLCVESQLIEIMGYFPGNNLKYIEQVYGSKAHPSTKLYDLVWKPMDAFLQGSARVYISPVGMLHKISFAALSNGSGEYLSDQYDIENVSSTAKITYNKEVQIKEENSIVIFGGVDYNSEATQKEIWSYLEGTLSETTTINKIVNQKNRKVQFYSGKEATEDAFKEHASGSQVLHIATHGFFYVDPKDIENKFEMVDESEGDLAFRGSGKSSLGYSAFVENQNPLMRSGLVLAGANDVWTKAELEGEDGVLTAQEVSTLDLRNTNLVVLSACETGLGDIKGSEGVYGLQRAFKMAGAHYLIMSLWQVPDKETAEFMTTFYKHLMKSNDIHASFNKTQAIMRKKYDPYYWAAFVLVE